MADDSGLTETPDAAELTTPVPPPAPPALATAAGLGLALKVDTLGAPSAWIASRLVAQVAGNAMAYDWVGAEAAAATAAAAWLAQTASSATSYAVQRDMAGHTFTLALYA